jgi:hypothetical protein
MISKFCLFERKINVEHQRNIFPPKFIWEIWEIELYKGLVYLDLGLLCKKAIFASGYWPLSYIVESWNAKRSFCILFPYLGQLLGVQRTLSSGPSW